MNEEQIAGLSKLLIGILNAQNAIIEALNRTQAASRGDILLSIQAAANIIKTAPPTLEDLPARILLQMQTAVEPEHVHAREMWIREELGKLLR